MAKDRKPKKEKKKKSEKTGGEVVKPAIEPRLQTRYREEVVPKLKEELKAKNSMRVPRLQRVVINAGLGRATQNIKVIEQAIEDLAAITGQKPVSTKSKAAISNFKLRSGLPIGVMVTLRGANMWEFVDRLISLALPRIRDFRGVSDRAFDGNGNYTLGLKDQVVFPEVDFESAESTFGMNITFVTTADNNEEGYALLKHLGMPFRKRSEKKKAA